MRSVSGIVLAAGVVATVLIGAAVDRSAHSVSDTLYGAALPVLLVWILVGGVLVVLRHRPNRG